MTLNPYGLEDQLGRWPAGPYNGWRERPPAKSSHTDCAHDGLIMWKNYDALRSSTVEALEEMSRTIRESTPTMAQVLENLPHLFPSRPTPSLGSIFYIWAKDDDLEPLNPRLPAHS